jgi:hypothetical protein
MKWGKEMTAMLSKEDFKRLLQPLEEAFNTTLPKARLMALYGDLKGFGDYHLEKAVTYLINNKPYMPINADIIIATRVEAEKEWAAKKEEEHRQANEFFDPKKYGKGFNRDAIVCIRKVLQAETRKDVINLMVEMEEKYPGIGYEIEAKKLENHFRKHGKKLSGKVGAI